MKTFKLFAGAAALLAMGTLASCSSDEPGGGSDVVEKDHSLYLKVAISDVNAGSRAANTTANFEDGTEDENKIGNLQFKFFDAAGTQIYQTTVQDVTLTTPTTDPYPSVGKQAVAVVKVDVAQGQNMPAYVVCFANPVQWTEVEGDIKMHDLRNKTRDNYLGTQGNFAMNNAVYFGNDPISGANNVKMVGAPIQKGQLFTSEAEATKATEGSVVDIYIERYAAKVKMTIANEAITASTVGKATLTFVPETWGITADAANMYAVKRFSTEDGDDAPIPTLAEVQASLGTWTTWNDAPLHRSYWACSPAYYATSFPSVSDDIVDIAAQGSTGAGEIVGDYKLKYYSYNQMTNNGDHASSIEANGATIARYTLENTMGAQAFASRNPKAAAPSVLLVGHTNLTYDGVEVPANTTFYIWGGDVYFQNVPEGVTTGETLVNKLIATQTILASDANGAKVTTAGNSLAVMHPAKASRDVTGVKLSEELVTLQVTNATDLYYKPMGSDQWTSLADGGADAIAYVNRQLAGQLNYANAYTHGKSYFTIPVQHLGMTENTAGLPTTDGKLDWEKVRVGDFGLVRNHVYNINVSKIEGYGSGILNLDYPIITPMETNNYYIKYTLNVLNWRIVPTQNVEL